MTSIRVLIYRVDCGIISSPVALHPAMLRKVQKSGIGISLYLDTSAVPIVLAWSSPEAAQSIVDSLVLASQVSPAERDRILAEFTSRQAMTRGGTRA